MKVLIADKFADTGIEALGGLGCDVDCNPELKGDALTQAVRDSNCQVLIVRSTKVERATLEAGESLKMIIRAGSGFDTIDFEGAAELDIRVCNCPGMNSVAVAELTIGLMVALDRRIVDETVDLRRGVWNKKEYSKARGLKGRTLGVVGLGRIGYEVAKRAKAFDMNLIYCDVVLQSKAEEELGIKKVAFEQVLSDADFISLHVPGGEGTRHVIGRDELKRMKPTAFLFNCSRGGVVDQEALAEALRDGVIAGAGLDVYENEPGASDKEFKDPVVQAPGLYGTHHVGASTEQAQDAVAEEVVRIVQAFKTGGEFLHCVNPAAPAAT